MEEMIRQMMLQQGKEKSIQTKQVKVHIDGPIIIKMNGHDVMVEDPDNSFLELTVKEIELPNGEITKAITSVGTLNLKGSILLPMVSTELENLIGIEEYNSLF